MKFLVCFIVLIANISDNSKASLESYVPTSSNILFEDTTRNSDKSCNRPCKFNVKPRRCYYDFTIKPMVDENGRTSISVNGMIPGPPINVCVNDVIVVEVKNKIPDQDLTIHWHGVEQKGTPHMDGVPMVTQCPITYGTSYKYAFIASSPGTFFYHADSVSHQSDGVFGSLIVNQPQPQDPHAALYDYDRSDENTFIIAANFPTLLSANLEDTTLIHPTSLTINGDVENFKLFVMSGYAYKLRLINAIAIECPVLVEIDQHEMMVIATDGKPVKPVSARTVKLYPGERMDVVVRATQETGGYWVRATAGGTCAGVGASAMLLYSGFNYTSMLNQGVNEVADVNNQAFDTAVFGQMLESLQKTGVSSESSSDTIYLGIDKKQFKVKEKDIDFRYISDAIPKKPFYPASFGLKSNGVVQINGKSFLYPNAPFLLYPQDMKKDFICRVGEESINQEPQCMMVIEPEGEVELALVNEGFNSNDSYTFHIHGPSASVVSTWRQSQGQPLSREEFQRLDKEGAVIRNLQNPPLKDTIVVPNKGFVVIRVSPEQGSWLLECRACSQSSLPAAIIINAPLKIPKTVVRSLAKCGNYRPPDVLLN